MVSNQTRSFVDFGIATTLVSLLLLFPTMPHHHFYVLALKCYQTRDNLSLTLERPVECPPRTQSCGKIIGEGSDQSFICTDTRCPREKRCAFYPSSIYCCCTTDGCNDDGLGVQGRHFEGLSPTNVPPTTTPRMPSSSPNLKCYQLQQDSSLPLQRPAMECPNLIGSQLSWASCVKTIDLTYNVTAYACSSSPCSVYGMTSPCKTDSNHVYCCCSTDGCNNDALGKGP